MIGFVYMWTNIQNGKRYIGSHVGSTDDGYLGSGILFRKSINKYGKNNFVRTILYEEYISEKSLREKEVDIINEYNACENETFYNLRKHAVFETSSKSLSDITREKISEARKIYYSDPKNRDSHSLIMKEKWKDPEYRKKRQKTIDSEEYKKTMRDKNVSEKNPMYGKNITEEHKKLLSERNAGKGNPFYGKKHRKETIERLKQKANRQYGKDNPASVKIKIYGVIYDTIKSAMKNTGMSYKKINKLGERIK